jgi:hypothetical protein
MYPMDITSLLFLFLGKENQWAPFLLVLILALKNREELMAGIKSLLALRHSEYTLSGKLYTSKSGAYTYGELPDPMYGILYFLQSHSLSCTQKLQTFDVSDTKLASLHRTILLPVNDRTIQLTPTIACTVYITRESFQARSEVDVKPKDFEEISVMIRLRGKDIETSRILEYVAASQKVFENDYAKKKQDGLYIYQPNIAKDDLPYTPSPSTIKFTSKKTFDTLFFDEKEELLRRLTIFRDRETNHFYRRMGIPETFGLLLHGPPGTGKTSLIKSIANFMQMNLVLVPMSKIKTKSDLESVFYNDGISHKSIYVFEEIDCNGWEHIVCDRVTPFLPTPPKDSVIVLSGDQVKLPKKEEDKITLGSLLEVIDGLIEMTGRIIIMTTNHRNCIDPALIRPGRIDMEIEFKKLRKEHIASIYETMYGVPLHSSDQQRIPDFKYTQAEITQHLFRYGNAPAEFIKSICK